MNASEVRQEAEAQTVEDLVRLVEQGRVRIPDFQRELNWDAEDVLDLYDSIHKGYPVGAVLMRKGKAPARRVQLGPLVIDAPEMPEALWVVDGQQRLVALTAGLARPSPTPDTPDDPYVVYFDTATQTFEQPDRQPGVPSTWVPVAKLLDASELQEWMFGWEHAQDEGRRKIVFDAGKRLRQYRIPQYVVTTDDEELLREIFYRINNSGKALKWSDVHDALYGQPETHPSKLEDLACEIAALGMGTPSEEQVLSCVMAHQGLDVTRNIDDHYTKNPEALRGAVQEALPAVRHTYSFLRERAEIPHQRLLPRSTPLTVLTRFFGAFPDPNPRTLTLLVRWTWRVLLEAATLDRRTLQRRGVTVVGEKSNEEDAVQALLGHVSDTPPPAYSLPGSFDARSAVSRLALLGLAALAPRRLDDGAGIDVAALIEKNGRDAFRRVWHSGHEGEAASSPANRVLLPGTGSARSTLARYLDGTPDDEVLQSHGITQAAAGALLRGDAEAFVVERGGVIEEAVRETTTRLAGWGHTDRASIAHTLETAGAA